MTHIPRLHDALKNEGRDNRKKLRTLRIEKSTHNSLCTQKKHVSGHIHTTQGNLSSRAAIFITTVSLYINATRSISALPDLFTGSFR